MAQDVGYTLDISRRMPSGWKAGIFFSRTNVSAEDFGEGSFDKGIFFNIPINAFSPFETRSSIYEKIRPVQGDGGQRVGVRGRINEIVRQHSKDKYLNSWNRLWR